MPPTFDAPLAALPPWPFFRRARHAWHIVAVGSARLLPLLLLLLRLLCMIRLATDCIGVVVAAATLFVGRVRLHLIKVSESAGVVHAQGSIGRAPFPDERSSVDRMHGHIGGDAWRSTHVGPRSVRQRRVPDDQRPRLTLDRDGLRLKLSCGGALGRSAERFAGCVADQSSSRRWKPGTTRRAP